MSEAIENMSVEKLLWNTRMYPGCVSASESSAELGRRVKLLSDEVARLTKLKEAFAKTTKGNITINRYEHGGGRMFVDDGKNRDLIADTYNEGDREFIALCYEAFAALTPQAGKGGGE